MKITVKKITPVTPTKSMANQYTSIKEYWEGKPQENVFEDVFKKATEKALENVGIAKKKAHIDFLHSNDAYDFHQGKKYNITEFSSKTKDMYLGFVREEKDGCYVTAKVPKPTEKSVGIHIGVRYYDPEDGTFNVYPKTKKGYPHTHFFTKTIVRSSKWKEHASDVIEKGMTKCLKTYGMKDPKNRADKVTKIEGEEIRQISKATSGSWWNNSCYNDQAWKREQQTCWKINIPNFGGSNKIAFIGLRPHSKYTDFTQGKKIKYNPKDFICSPVKNYGLDCQLKSGKKIELIE